MEGEGGRRQYCVKRQQYLIFVRVDKLDGSTAVSNGDRTDNQVLAVRVANHIADVTVSQQSQFFCGVLRFPWTSG